MSNISFNKGVSNKNKSLRSNIIRNMKEGSTTIIDTKTKCETNNENKYENSNHNIKYSYTATNLENEVEDKVSSVTKNIIHSPDERFAGNNILHGQSRTHSSPSNKKIKRMI